MKSLQLQKPHMLVVVGIPGAGKTFFASQFSDMFNAPYIDYGYYANVTGDNKTAHELANHTLEQIIKTGQTFIVEGIGNQLEERRVLGRIAKKNGYSIIYIWIQTEPVTAQRRAAKTSSFDENTFAEKAGQFEIFTKAEPFIVVSGRHTYATQAKVILKRLTATRPSASILPIAPRIIPPRNRTSG